MLLLSRAMPNNAFSFLPKCTACIPCHFKLDTECVTQLFWTAKERKTLREEFPEREDFNNQVWSQMLNLDAIRRKLTKWKFHHKISTDGVPASILYSRQTDKSIGVNAKKSTSAYRVSLDPGKYNVVMMIDKRGQTLKYTTSQCNQESTNIY